MDCYKEAIGFCYDYYRKLLLRGTTDDVKLYRVARCRVERLFG